jgi:hypothetical protein
MKKTIMRVAGVSVVALSGLAVAASPASAALGPCDHFQSNIRTVAAYCQGTPPTSFEEHAICTTSGGYEYNRSGASEWAGGQIWSVARCAAGDVLVNWWIGVHHP